MNSCIVVPGADALVHNHADRHQFLVQFSGEVVGDGLSHTEKYTGGTKLIDMVEDMSSIEEAKLVINMLVWKGLRSISALGKSPQRSNRRTIAITK